MSEERPIYFKRKRQKWFSARHWSCGDSEENGWFGPHDTMEQAIAEAASWEEDGEGIYVTQGYKRTKVEREDYCHEFEWEVDATAALKITRPPKDGWSLKSPPY